MTNKIKNVFITSKSQGVKRSYKELSDKMTDCIYIEWVYGDIKHELDVSLLSCDMFHISILKKIQKIHITTYYMDERKDLIVEGDATIKCYVNLIPLISNDFIKYALKIGKQEAVDSISLEFISDDSEYGALVAFGFSYDKIEFRKINLDTGEIGGLIGNGRM